MKKYLVVWGLALGLLLGSASLASGQVAGGGYSNAGTAWLQSVQNGNMGPVLALLIIREATPYFQGQSGLGFLQLVQRYYSGQLTITVIPADPVTGAPLSFRVACAGGIITIMIQDLS